MSAYIGAIGGFALGMLINDAGGSIYHVIIGAIILGASVAAARGFK